MEYSTKSKYTGLLVFILTIGVFGIINTEMGVVGILPLIAEKFEITVPQAGWTVSAFALVVALSGPVMPLLCSGINRKTIMLLTLGIFILSNAISIFTTSYTVILITRIIPAFFHPVYVSMAFAVAASSVDCKDSPKAVSKVFIGVSGGMVLGVPVTSFIASQTSFAMAMVFFTSVNAFVFLATLLFIPSMPVSRRASYGEQIKVLKKSITQHSIMAVILINAAMFGLFSYLSDYLQNETKFSFTHISVILFIYGAANIVGNIAAGRLLSNNAAKTIIAIPFLLSIGYVSLFIMGSQTWPTTLIILLLGILAGIASNNSQYMIANSARESPDFANGLFLTSANLGTTIGTAVCGMFITSMGTRYSIIGALIFVTGSVIFIFLRQHTAKHTKIVPNPSVNYFSP